MMMTSRIMPACFCLFLSACGLFLPSAPEAVTYYELDSGACEAKQTANGPLSESRLTLHSTYVTGLTNSRKIVFSREPGTRASYQYAVWVEPPAQRLPQLLLRRLECEGIYRTVTLRSSLAAADLALNLELEDFFHDVASGRNEVVVGLRAELVDLQSREIIKSKNFSKRVLAPSKDAQSAVKSFNQAVRDLLEDMISWLP